MIQAILYFGVALGLFFLIPSTTPHERLIGLLGLAFLIIIGEGLRAIAEAIRYHAGALLFATSAESTIIKTCKRKDAKHEHQTTPITQGITSPKNGL